MSADNGWYVAKRADGKYWVFGGFESYVGEWGSRAYDPPVEEKIDYIEGRHCPEVHKAFDNKDEAILYAHKLEDGEIDSYWNPRTDMFGYGTEYGVGILEDLDF